MQRSNHAEVDIDPDQADGAAEGSGRRGRGTARQTLISDKRPSVHPNKKSTMNIRSALLYKKNLATLIEESVGILPKITEKITLISCLKGYWEPAPIHTKLPFRRRPASEGTPAFVLLRLRVLG